MLQDILAIFHIFLCVSLIGLILIQHGKGADAGAAFGSGASSTVFGSQGSASFLTRATAVLATLFFLICMVLAYFSMQRIEPKSVLESSQPTVTEETPAVPSQEDKSELPPIETSPNRGTTVDNEVPSVPVE